MALPPLLALLLQVVVLVPSLPQPVAMVPQLLCASAVSLSPPLLLLCAVQLLLLALLLLLLGGALLLLVTPPLSSLLRPLLLVVALVPLPLLALLLLPGVALLLLAVRPLPLSLAVPPVTVRSRLSGALVSLLASLLLLGAVVLLPFASLPPTLGGAAWPLLPVVFFCPLGLV
jgi:hypothetical protein